MSAFSIASLEALHIADACAVALERDTAFFLDPADALPGNFVSLDPSGSKRVPRRFAAYVLRKPDDGPNVALVVEPRAGRMAVVWIAFEYAATTGPHNGILSTHLRATALDRYARQAAALLTISVSTDPETGRAIGQYPDEQHVPYLKLAENAIAIDRALRREITPDLLSRVAQLYRTEVSQAAQEKRKARPAHHIQRELGVSHSTATRYIGLARKNDHLGPALGTRAGEAPPD